MIQFDAVIFDMDGLLFDTETLGNRLNGEVLAEMGFTLTHELIMAALGRNEASARRSYSEHLGPTFDYDVMRDRYKQRKSEHIEKYGLPPKEGATQLLKWLGERGIPIGLGTSSSRESAIRNLTVSGLRSHFRVVVGGDMVAHGKPAPDIYLAAARELAVAPQRCVVFEDSPAGIAAAVAAGMTAVMVPDLVEPNEQTRAMVATVLSSLADAPLWLSGKVGQMRQG